MEAITHIVFYTLLWASLSTVIVLLLAVPLAYLITRTHFRGKDILTSIAGLPLVLPPTAVGFLLLLLLSDSGILGRLNLLLSWKAVVLACSVMSFPLVLRTARVSFEAVNPRLEAMSRTLGHGPCKTFCSITLPLAARGILAAAILGFTRAMGEFGATVIIAGNIPGRTQTLSSAIYSAQQSGNDQQANTLLVIALTIGFAAVFISERLSRPTKGAAR